MEATAVDTLLRGWEEVRESIRDALAREPEAAAILDRSGALRRLAADARADVGADVAAVWETVPGRDCLVLSYLIGARRPFPDGVVVPAGQGLGGKALMLARPERVRDYPTAGGITHEFDYVVRIDDLHAMMAVPVSGGGRVYGVVYVALRDVADFGDGAMDKVRRAADRTAAAVRVADLSARQAELAVQAERHRMASNLHDNLGAILFRLGAEVRDLRVRHDGDEQLLQRLQGIETQIAAASSALRNAAAAMHGAGRAGALAVVVRADCDAFQRRCGISAEAITMGELPAIDSFREEAVAAAVREALLNVEKHAHATSVVVTLAAAPGRLTAAVSDNGRPAPPVEQPRQDGLGLVTSRERLARVGGSCDLVENDEGGHTFRAWVPVA